MIDFIKIKISDEALINQVWNNEILIYEGKSEKRFDDEIKELFSKSYKNLYFTKFQNRLEIKGSLHYFFNDKKVPTDENRDWDFFLIIFWGQKSQFKNQKALKISN